MQTYENNYNLTSSLRKPSFKNTFQLGNKENPKQDTSLSSRKQTLRFMENTNEKNKSNIIEPHTYNILMFKIFEDFSFIHFKNLPKEKIY